MPPLRKTGADREAEGPDYAGEYRLQACLGAGGMGVVHLATSASGLRLAVKVVHEQYAEDPEFRARFRQEVAAARRVSGAFTAPVVDADPDAVRPWMATLYVPGPTLADQVKRSGPLSPAELRRLTAGLAEALRDIHRAGVVHRDLKPSNVLLTDSGPKVIDFGISRPVDSDLRTETGKLIGSPPFMAPEQFQRPREVGPAADVFALGSVLVHAATGHGPFDSESPYIVAYQVVHDEPDLTGVPEELAPLVARCLAKEPGERPTPAEIMAALLPPSYEAAAFIPAQRRPVLPPADPGADAGAAWDADTPVRAVAPAAAARRRRRRRVPLAVAAALVLAAGGTVAALSYGGGSAPAPPHPAEAAKTFSGWRTALQKGGEPAAPACVHDGGALYCSARGIAAARLDPATGRIVWSRPGPAGEMPPPAPAPLAGGRIAAGPAPGELRTYGADGTPGWQRTSKGSRPESPHAAGDVLVLSDGTAVLRAVDAATGRELWHHALRGHPYPVPGAYDPATGLLTVTEVLADGRHTRVSTVRPRTGEVVRQIRLTGALSPADEVRDGALVLAAVNPEGLAEAVVRYGLADGSVHRTALPYPVDSPSLAAHGNVVHLLTSGGRLSALDVSGARGRLLWELETAATHVSAPVVSPDGTRLYLSAPDGRLLAVDAHRGTLLGQTSPRLADGRLSTASRFPAPTLADGHVYGTAPDGSVFAVDAGDPGGW
ncbi:PQQ-binding-like beta-propeller repeat protein [Streptomyces sp. NPDC048623]|uniref:serine/threonine-protein kinase n=1 Tax=Streptomyces sp. NPDC048623 TaxID=3155761 RepID=UPI003412D89D